MAEVETQDEGQILDTPEVQTTAENTSEEDGAGSPPAQIEDWQGKAREYEAKLIRQEERNRFLEQTAQLQERYLQQQRQAPSQESSLSPELAELDKTLDPLFSKRLKGHIDPLSSSLAAALDGQDAIRFEMHLQRHNPEVLANEDAYARVMQGVEQVRQQAAQVYGKNLTRVDAYLYLEGLESVKEKGKSRTTKKQAQVTEEAKRQLQKQATQSGVSQTEAKRVPGADIAAIRRKMAAGEKVTPEEKAKFRKHLENAKF